MSEKGYEGVSVREICKEAETSNNMIHHYFGDKDGLRRAILDQYAEAVFAIPMRLFETEVRSRDDFMARFRLLFETTLEACIINREPMLLALREQARMDVLINYQNEFIAFLERAKAAGYVRAALDAGMISGAVLDRVTNYVQYSAWVEKSFDLKPLTDLEYRAHWVNANLDLFLNGILAGA